MFRPSRQEESDDGHRPEGDRELCFNLCFHNSRTVNYTVAFYYYQINSTCDDVSIARMLRSTLAPLLPIPLTTLLLSSLALVHMRVAC
ncbi:hypothetical protein QCA50_020468 [Cerrena zonata]|uniref:Uncharacterized protein n=1 Tax=Cerrena zonata TaxID=2478898 RepID=A0AAW0F6Y7_9APHY